MSPFVRLLLLLLLALPLGACGYRFPGEQAGMAVPALQGATLRVVGEGAKDSPHLAHKLREKLSRRLGLIGAAPAPASDKPKPELEVHLARLERNLLLEDRGGLADLFRIIITAQPVLKVNGQPAPIQLQGAQGMATYNERYAHTPSRATRAQAEEEALDQLVESLGATITAGLNRGY